MLHILEVSQVQKASGFSYFPAELEGFYHFPLVFGPFLLLR